MTERQKHMIEKIGKHHPIDIYPASKGAIRVISHNIALRVDLAFVVKPNGATSLE